MSDALATTRREKFETARALVESARRVVLTTHVQPDGDGIGSSVALARWLRAEGKEVTILAPTPISRRFRFLEAIEPVEAFESARGEDLLAAADLLVVLDISVPGRLGPLEPLVERYAPPVLILDHHVGPPEIDGVDVRDTEAAATGEIVYRLLVAWGAEIDPAMATALYAAIAYDTGGFRYANTRATTHEIAGDLVRRGANLELVRRQLYESISEGRARLLAHVLSSYQRSPSGRLVWVALSRSTIDSLRADPEDIDGAAEALRSLEGVEVAIVVREIRPNATKVSFRSRGPDDVNAFARRFGGGGHRNASGAFFEEPLATVVERVVGAARATFEPAEKARR